MMVSHEDPQGWFFDILMFLNKLIDRAKQASCHIRHQHQRQIHPPHLSQQQLSLTLSHSHPLTVLSTGGQLPSDDITHPSSCSTDGDRNRCWLLGASLDNHNFLYPPPVAGPRVRLTSALSISLIIKPLARTKFVGNHPPACHVPCISFLMAL